MKNLTILVLLVSALTLVGCGADSGTTPQQDADFKSGTKPTINMPPGANAPPPNFKSSLDNGGGPRPPASGN